MASRGSALAKDPALLREDEEICDRVREDLLRCAEHCRIEAVAARDENFSSALNAVARACEAGITALERHLDSLERGGPSRAKDALTAPEHEPVKEAHKVSQEEEWRPGSKPTPAD